MKFSSVIAAVFCFLAMQAAAIDASNRFRSPRNPERGIRPTTSLIVLHTTEAPARSSLNKLSERGEAHYCVTEEGSVFRIVDRDRIAYHAGRSRWHGRESVDNFSVGIECVGYHDRPMPVKQLDAIRKLVKELQAMYKLSDDKVVAHSHVAYGTPNKWQKCCHRGRKRCGMLFAMPSIRSRLGLKTRPGSDFDTSKAAGRNRLAIGDPYLQRVLYGNVDTMVGRVAPPPASILTGISKWFAKADAKPQVKSAPKPKPKPKPKKTTPATAQKKKQK